MVLYPRHRQELLANLRGIAEEEGFRERWDPFLIVAQISSWGHSWIMDRRWSTLLVLQSCDNSKPHLSYDFVDIRQEDCCFFVHPFCEYFKPRSLFCVPFAGCTVCAWVEIIACERPCCSQIPTASL
jgi:hypothetical protein